jgi:hypothetical protein
MGASSQEQTRHVVLTSMQEDGKRFLLTGKANFFFLKEDGQLKQCGSASRAQFQVAKVETENNAYFSPWRKGKM